MAIQREGGKAVWLRSGRARHRQTQIVRPGKSRVAIRNGAVAGTGIQDSHLWPASVGILTGGGCAALRGPKGSPKEKS